MCVCWEGGGEFQVALKFEYNVCLSKGLTEFNNTLQTVATASNLSPSLTISLSLSGFFHITICYRNKLLKILGRLFPNLSQYFACCYLVSSLFLSRSVRKLYISVYIITWKTHKTRERARERYSHWVNSNFRRIVWPETFVQIAQKFKLQRRHNS